MRELERLLINSGAQDVKTAGLVESFGGKLFLHCQKVASSLPNFLLFECVHAGGGIALLIVPYGLDFDKDEFVSIAGDDVEFSATVSVVAG